MKKINLWLLASLFTAALTLTACGGDDEPAGNNGGNNGSDPVVPALTVNDLTGTTWEVYASKQKAPDVYQKLKLDAANGSFTLHKQISESDFRDYKGTWKEADGNILLSYALYEDGKPINSKLEVPLHFSRYGNGVLLYTDDFEICEVFVHEGETLDVSKVSTAGHELLGKWKEGDDQEYILFTFNANGICEIGNISPDTKYLSTSSFIDIPKSAENAPKRIIWILHEDAEYSNGEYQSTYYSTGGDIYSYTISDGKLYIYGGNLTMEEILQTTPFTKVTE